GKHFPEFAWADIGIRGNPGRNGAGMGRIVEISIHGRFPEGTKRERQGSDIREREMSPLPRKIRVWMKKEEIAGAALAGATAVVMDVCLATTTLLKIVEGGPRRVIPTGSLEEACRLAEELDSPRLDRKSTRLNSSHVKISYAVFCVKKKTGPHPGGGA